MSVCVCVWGYVSVCVCVCVYENRSESKIKRIRFCGRPNTLHVCIRSEGSAGRKLQLCYNLIT